MEYPARLFLLSAGLEVNSLNTNLAYSFTETELDIAKHTDLLGLLPSLGYTLKRIGSYYTGSTSSKYATGYTVSADYSGEVSKTGCNVVTYTAVFGSTEAPKDLLGGDTQSGEPADISGIKRPIMIGGAVLVLALGGAFVYKKIKEGR